MTQTRLIIVRHGNTFLSGEKPRRVGAKTDIPLVPSGEEQGNRLGEYFRVHEKEISLVYAGNLKRSQTTAKLIAKSLNGAPLVQISDIFSEIDFGPDENLPEEEVLARVGVAGMEAWETRGEIPQGWLASRESLITSWFNFAKAFVSEHKGGTTLVVTSSGTARFALALTKSNTLEGALNCDLSLVGVPLKIRTGAFGILSHTDATGWSIDAWDVRP